MHVSRRTDLAGAIQYAVLLCACLLSAPTYADAGHKVRVALFIDNGTEAGDFIKEFRRNIDEDVVYRRVDSDQIRDGALRKFDALLIPGGSASRESASLGREAREEIRRFVNDGGIYMGVCAGAYLASREDRYDLGLLPLKTLDADHWYRVDEDKEAVVDVELTPAGQDVFGVIRGNIKLVYCNGPIFAPPDKSLVDESFTPLGFFRSEVVADGGEKGVMLGAPAMVLSRYGKGIVLAISPHPEETPGLKQIEIRALHWLYDHRNGGRAAVHAGLNAADLTSTVPPGQRLLRDGIEPSHKPSRWNSKPQAIDHQKTRLAEQEQEQTREREEANERGKANKREQSYSSNLSEQALRLAQSVFDQASVVSYVHKAVPALRQVVTQEDGTVRARTDCSGFISYIVRSVAPRHYQVVRERQPARSYPQAKIWARFFDTLDSDRPRDGWLGIRNWRDLRPGDIIAWVESKESHSDNTGHVMMVAGQPSDLQTTERGYRYFQVPVIDSSTTYHFSPEHLPPNAHQEHRDGLGMGCVRIILSQEDQPIGYWAGTYWGAGHKEVKGPARSDVVRFARMVPITQDADD